MFDGQPTPEADMNVAENIGRALLMAIWASQTGTKAARDNFILANKGLAYNLAKSAHPAGCSRGDVQQAALVGLLEAVNTFDPLRGCAFSTHAHWRINKEIKMLFAKAPSADVPINTFWKAIKVCQQEGEDMPPAMTPAASMDSARVDDGRTLADVIGTDATQDADAETAWQIAALVDVARMLLARARNTVKGREMLNFRLDVLAYRIAPTALGCDPLTLDQIGQAHDTCRERARQVEADVLSLVRDRMTV